MQMALPLSGSPKERELVVLETTTLTCVIKGTAAHPQYNKLRKHMPFKVEDAMQFYGRADDLEEVQVYNALTEQLEVYEGQSLLPIFFENGRYEVIIIPKTKESLTFYHEFPSFREAVQKVSRSDFLTGILHFQNEVGLTSFEIHGANGRVLLTVLLEVYPTKLDYKTDYKALLDEVNDEIYNLAYHFIKRTYLQGSATIYKEPSLSEFYRLIQVHFEQYKRAIERIERNAHRQLTKTYVEVRGDRLGRQDARALSYLRRNAGKFVDVPNGIEVHGRRMMPIKGLRIQKEHSIDTYENQYVKWTMTRILTRLTDLKRVVRKAYARGYHQLDELSEMIEWVERRKKTHFWRHIGLLDRSMMSLVLQMAPGYRSVLQVYATISKSIVLHGEIYKMSVKDIATLYEYWTFLKLGQILDDKCTPISQDIVKVNMNGLFVRLDKSKSAERKYEHPITKEEITLKYQFDTNTNRVPTVQQKPDTMLSIGKKGRDYQYQYIFDAKYRLDLESNSYYPGPMQDDVNTMHRYRDSIVVNTDGRYERTAFGAYVLFPWSDEASYQSHPLYKSIDSVNIGGFPFLPNATNLVERFIDNLLNKSPEELQEEGILPKGTYEEIDQLYSVDRVFICFVYGDSRLQQILHEKKCRMSIEGKLENWDIIRFIAIYEADSMHIQYYAEIVHVEIDEGEVVFTVAHWQSKLIEGKNHRLQQGFTVHKNRFLQADSLADLYTKSKEEEILWKVLQRISSEVTVNLNQLFIDQASYIKSFTFSNYKVEILHESKALRFTGDGIHEVMNIALINDNHSYIFKRIIELTYPHVDKNNPRHC